MAQKHYFAIYRGGIKKLDYPVKTYSEDQAGTYYAQKVLSPPQPYWGKLKNELKFVDLGLNYWSAMQAFQELPQKFSDIPRKDKPQEFKERPENEKVTQMTIKDLGV